MQYFKREKITGLLAALVIFIGGTSAALAVGTASGTTVSNTATVDYLVGGDARTANGAVTFDVDNRVDLTVVNQDVGNNVNVVPGSNDQVLEFLVTNTGNATQGYLLSVVNGPLAINMNNVEIYIDNGNDTWDGTGTETLYVAGTNAFNLDPNAGGGAEDITVYIVADTPVTATTGQVDDYRLLVETAPAGVVGAATAAVTAAVAPTAAGDEIVFADNIAPGVPGPEDGVRDGAHSAAATFTVQSAALTVTKTIVNVNDEFNGDGGYSIPNAVVRYQVVIENTGTAPITANSLVFTDPIPTETKVCFAVVAVTGRCAAADLPSITTAGSSITGSTLAYDDGTTAFTYAPTADAQGADTAVSDIRYTTTGFLDAGESITITFGVVIE